MTETTRNPESIVLPYGTSPLRADQIVTRGEAGALQTVDCPAPCVIIDTGRPLRLNGGQYAFREPPDLRTMTDAMAQLDFLKHHLKQFCDLWARPPKLFLDGYFDFIADEIDRNRDALDDRLAPFGGLYRTLDWALSAPRPLPRAQILAGAGLVCPVDFAFWLGNRLLAIDLLGTNTVTARQKEIRLALQKAGIDVLEISATRLAGEGTAYLREKLPPDFTAFWTGEPMPSSPFKGTSLGEIIRG